MRLAKALTFSFLFLMLFSAHASAAVVDTKTNELFNKGVDAFGTGDYETALVWFTAAQEAGLDSAALHYNLGVSYFKLEKYKGAAAEFQRLLNDPGTEALARYNLGLIALRTQNQSEAQSHFQSALRLSGNDKLKELAARQLEKLEKEPARSTTWSGYVSLGAGRDDNVTLDIEGTVDSSAVRDEFAELYAYGNVQLAGSQKNGVQVNVRGYQLTYRDIDEFDYTNLEISPEIDRQWGGWHTSFTGNIGLVYLGGAFFERLAGSGIRGVRPLTPDLSLDLGYQFTHIAAEDDYDYLSGMSHQFSFGVRSTLFDAHSRLNYFLELNSRNDDSYPTRHGIRINVNKDIDAFWATELLLGYRFSEYQGLPRKDKRLRLGVKLSRKIPWGVKLFGKYIYTRNDSNDEQNEYENNTVVFGLERYF